MERRYEFFVRVARTISHEWAKRTSEILFLPLEHKIHIFEPMSNVLFIIWRLNIEYFRFYCVSKQSPNRKYKSTRCQVYRNTTPNEAKFCELILDVNTEKKYWLWLESSDTVIFSFFSCSFTGVISSISLFLSQASNSYVVQGFLLRVSVFNFFCKLFNFFVADGCKPARHRLLF